VGSLPTMKPREIARLLGCLGFALIRQRGSHRQYAHPDGRRTTLPLHSGRDLSPVLLRLIARDVGPTPAELLEACGKRP
jgi:predicted RNA binding protein YcfA (HicA-like mRNA interferase family)